MSGSISHRDQSRVVAAQETSPAHAFQEAEEAPLAGAVVILISVRVAGGACTVCPAGACARATEGGTTGSAPDQSAPALYRAPWAVQVQSMPSAAARG